MSERVEMVVFDGAKLLAVAWPFAASGGRRCAAYGDVVLTGRRERNNVCRARTTPIGYSCRFRSVGRYPDLTTTERPR